MAQIRDGHVAEREEAQSPAVIDLTAPVVPQPTATSVEALQTRQPAVPQPIPIPLPIPFPTLQFGARFLIWKQDPTVGDPGIRTTYISGLTLNGPKDVRITTELPGTTPVARNASASSGGASGLQRTRHTCCSRWAETCASS